MNSSWRDKHIEDENLCDGDVNIKSIPLHYIVTLEIKNRCCQGKTRVYTKDKVINITIEETVQISQYKQVTTVSLETEIYESVENEINTKQIFCSKDNFNIDGAPLGLL